MSLVLDDQFRQHLLQSFPLSPDDLERLMRELANYYDQTIEEYVRLRHLGLQRQGCKNKEIYETIQTELESSRFRAGEISIRQIRRMIYG